MREGNLVYPKPYKVGPNGQSNGLKVILNQHCGFKSGQMVYEVKRPDGSILLIPEENFDIGEYI